MVFRDGYFWRIGRAGIGLLAGAACLAGLSSAVAAVTGTMLKSAASDAVSIAARGALGSFTPASVDPRLLETLRETRIARGDSANGLFRFTPADAVRRGSRAVTVAVRVDPETARAVSVQSSTGKEGSRGTLRTLAPAGFNLGMARGYQSFAQGGVETPALVGKRAISLSGSARDLDVPDLSRFTPARSSQESRFSTVIEVERGDLPGRAPRAPGPDGDVSVDVGGAYRVTGNLRVTAGFRYSADRDRLAPLTDGQQDNQAVYVGTQFRF